LRPCVDGAVLEKAARGKSNVTFSYPENANHILKNELQPRSALTGVSVQNTYNDATRVLDARPYKFSLRRYPRFRRSHLARDFSCEEPKSIWMARRALHPGQNKKGAKYTGKLSCISRLSRLTSEN
jgi:hypothetical protein